MRYTAQNLFLIFSIMRELRIFLAVVSLLLLATFTTSVLARENESDNDRRMTTSVHHSDDIDDDCNISSDDDCGSPRERAKERLKKLREKNAERIKKLREKRKDSHHAQTGATMSGAVTQTGATKPPVTTPTKPVTPTTPAPVVSAVTHSVTVNYNTPEWSVAVGFSVTAKGWVITAVSTTKKAGGTSGYYQDAFAQKVSSVAVGKKTAGLNLAAVGGASLTTTAFERFVAANF